MSALSDGISCIRRFMGSSTAQPDADLHVAARVFTEAWTDAARRLERIRALCADGLAWEAVQLAEAYPPLLEQCRALLFDGHADWIEQAELNDMSYPKTPLSTALLHPVNDAYVAADRLAPAMRALHRAVLSRAGFPQRIRALRALRDLAPGEAVWDADLRALEERRVHHLREALDRALADKDAGRIAWIQRRLHADTWSVPPDAALVQRADRARDAIAATAARNRHREVAGEVMARYAERDFGALEEAVARWNALPALLGSPPEDAAAHAAEALAWFDVERMRRATDQRFARDVRQIELMLAENAPVDLLEKTARDIDGYGRLLPEELALAVAKRRLAHDTERRRLAGQRLMMAVGGAVVLAALGAFGWWHYGRAKVADGERAAREEEQRGVAFAEAVVRARVAFDRAPRADHDAALDQLSQQVSTERDREALAALREHMQTFHQGDRAARAAAWRARLADWNRAIDAMDERLKQDDAPSEAERAAWSSIWRDIESEHTRPPDRDAVSEADASAFAALRARARRVNAALP